MPDLVISEANKEEISIWSNLQRYGAWKRVVMELEKKVEEADKIINTVGFDRDRMFSERDIALIKKQAYQFLIELPQTNIDLLTGTGVEQIEELDPFSNVDDEDPDKDRL